MPDSRDVEDSLRSLATDLDARSRPTTPAAAMARTAPVRRPRPRSGRVAAGVLAAVVVAAVAAGAGLTRGAGGDGGDRVETDQSPSSTPAPPAEVGTTMPPATQLPGVPFGDLPAAGFADVTAAGVVLFSLDGTELGTSAGWPGGVPGRGSDLVVLDDNGVTTVGVAPPDPAQIPEGCDAAAGAGGTRLALCDAANEIVRVDPSGDQARVAEAPAGYTWSRVRPSPDGRWLLAEATTDDCDNGMAALGPADGSEDPTTLVGDALTDGHAVGWLPDGRAVTQLVGGGCGQADIPSRVFASEPGGDDADLPIEPRGVLHMWSRADGGLGADLDRSFLRAAHEAGLETCCPAFVYGTDLAAGVVWDGSQVSVTATAHGVVLSTGGTLEVASVPGVEIGVESGPGGRVAWFACGDDIWHVGGAPLDVTDDPTVAAVASALIPYLYCTVAPISG
jgi:hypothetical protein